MEWLDGFNFEGRRLCAKIVSTDGIEHIADLRELAKRGLPTKTTYAPPKAFATDLIDWGYVNPSDYLYGIGINPSQCSSRHQVFDIQHGYHHYFVPALALLRGLFPLIPEAFEYLFSPRSLQSLCIPLERSGHWSVGMPDFRGAYRGRFRPATLESLTWASLFPSAFKAWSSIYPSICAGEMKINLPKARVQLLPAGFRIDRTVYVTSIKVSAVLALEEPFDFAANASPSFLWNSNASPLAANPNAYHKQGTSLPEADTLALTDEEWSLVKSIVDPSSPKLGRQPRDCRRAISDGIVLRLATSVRWADIAKTPLTPGALEYHWYAWRRTGQFKKFMEIMRMLRPDASYLQTMK